MRLMQLIYTSRPFGFGPEALDDILMSARRHNRANGITGALICRADLFVQLLEGPRSAVTRTFGRILQDDRHLDVALLHADDLETRLFPGWDMRDDPPRSWMWSLAEVRAGAAREATAASVRAIFARLAQEVAEPVRG
ncbi:BLUF domain-containing protein [Paeniroseomonas aquatica]|uniref:BLUF domain-containing protein n=1 Tax=Paeniroseomonas aquatica TaxID=373043 RepID=A0ABT8A5H0_9PROT|nr:BLUF domain-containing protein [Paeniroseomonas aquatica]MDN3565014.1 BLUF domain-containing protein [Paeniroseomonas aquatica]